MDQTHINTSKVPNIILASASPRRLELLRAHGFTPEVFAVAFDEQAHLQTLTPAASPKQIAESLALCKARVAYEELCEGGSSLVRSIIRNNPVPADRSIILAADTIVYKEGVGILGKPVSHDEAVCTLQALCDSTHQVITGMALIDMATGAEHSLADTTSVTFGEYHLSDIEDYLRTEPPFDKAGSYAIQGMWSKHVVAVNGDIENVIGLPLYRLEELLSGGYIPPN